MARAEDRRSPRRSPRFATHTHTHRAPAAACTSSCPTAPLVVGLCNILHSVCLLRFISGVV